MKYFLKTLSQCIFLLLIFSLLEALGMQVIKPNAKENHIHKYSDSRLKLVKILSVENNSISVEDLEENTVGSNLIYEISDIFIAAQELDSLRPKQLKISELKDKNGVLTYCELCRKALAFSAK